MEEEERIKFEKGSAFYNPQMRLCRSFSSLAIGAIGEKLGICDGLSATGIRGIRYAKENPNAESVDFVDIDETAVKLCRKNKARNKVKGKCFKDDLNSHLMNRNYDFLELDPFGSPTPHLYFALRSFRRKKSGYLSITATDTAVLCGAHFSACLKNYHSRPLHNELCHEAGIRILWKYAANISSEFDFGTLPLFSLSHGHYFKIMLKIERGAKKAVESEKKTGFLTYCPACGHREAGPIPLPECPLCKKQAQWAGPLWLGPLHSKSLLRKMGKLNEKRNYSDQGEIAKLLSIMEGEDSFPPYFFDIHAESRRAGKPSLISVKKAIKKLQENGFSAARTHFRPTSLKTTAGIKEFLRALG